MPGRTGFLGGPLRHAFASAAGVLLVAVCAGCGSEEGADGRYENEGGNASSTGGTGAASEGGTGADTGGATTGGEGGAAGGSTGGETSLRSCESPNSCVEPEDLGSMVGDKDAEASTATLSEYGSWHYEVLLLEEAALGDLEVEAVLNVPAGTDYDLVAYRTPNVSSWGQNATKGGPADCDNQEAESVNPGSADERLLITCPAAGDFDQDSCFVVFHVRHESGPCTANDKWTLTVRANP